MTRNLKALGLALVAMLAMGAMAATGAQAQETVEATASSYPTTIHGQSSAHAFTAEGSEVTCTISTFQGTITAQSAEIEVTPTYAGHCTAGGFPATVTHNGCKYRFHNGDTGAGSSFGVTTDLVCPSETGIQVHAYAGGAHGFSVCTITVPPQKNLEGVTLTNNQGTTDVTASGTVEDIKEHKSGLCGAGSTEEATYHLASTTITGTNSFHLIHNE